MIKITHNAGFFSCCSVRLSKIVEFANLYNKLPEIVDSSEQFNLYKPDKYKNMDITYHYFEHYNNMESIKISLPIFYDKSHQFINYGDLDFKNLTPLIQKYFSPSVKIDEILVFLKINIILHMIIHLLYIIEELIKKEVKLPLFDDFYKQIIEIINNNENIKILIQTDTSKFIDYINSKKLKNVFIIEENKTSYKDIGIHNEQSKDLNHYDMLYFLSTVLMISKCKYIICSSGNVCMWIMLFKGNNKNVRQLK